MKKTNYIAKAALTLLAALFSLTGARAETLTVYDDQTGTSQYVPAYTSGYYNRNTSYFTRSQFIIPASELSSMNGATVTAIKFYTNSTTAYTTPPCRVYVQEVTNAYFTTSGGGMNPTATFQTGGTQVFDGTFSNVQDGTSGAMTITFDSHYTYNGGNLLVSIENTEKVSQNGNITFYGKSSNSGNRTAVYGRNNNSLSSLTSGTAARFIPRTTFTYFFNPTVTASNVGPNSATISWNNDGNPSSYSLRYRLEGESTTTDFEDSSMGQWTTIEADGDNKNWELGSNPESYNSDPLTGAGHNGSKDFVVSGSFSNVTLSALTPDNYLVSPKITLGGTISFWAKGIDADYASEVFNVGVSTDGNTDASDFTMVGADKTATSTWTKYTFDLSAFSGEGYVAIRHYHVTDMFMLCVDDIVITEPGGEWETIDDITANSYELTGLSPETGYQIGVQAVYADGTSEWVGTHFTTLVEHPIPFDVVVDPVLAQSATISWTGYSDRYVVKYRRAKQDGSVSFLDDFENGISQWTIHTEGEGDGWGLYTMGDNHIVGAFSWDQTDGALDADNWLISPEVTLDQEIKFWTRIVPGFPDWYEVWFSTGTTVADFTTNGTKLQNLTAGANFNDWCQVSINTSSYAGQTGHVAIRHKCSDCYYLLIDNFGIYGSDVSGVEDWQTVTTTSTTIELTGLAPNTKYEFFITGIKEGCDDVSTNLANSSCVLLNDPATFTTLDGDFTVTVGKVGYTTFVAPFNISELPEGLEAYACQANNSIAIHLEPVAAIPEGEAVVLKNAEVGEAHTWTLTPATSSVGELSVTNDLLPSDGTVQGGTNIYALANKSKGVGFYPVSESICVPAGKGYLDMSGYTVKAFYGFEEDDDPTGIETIGNGQLTMDNAIYNVAGQRMGKMQKGINIVNGKKVLK